MHDLRSTHSPVLCARTILSCPSAFLSLWYNQIGRESAAPLQAQSEEQKYQVEALTAQLEHLTASKAQLESRCHLLEKAIKMREPRIDANPQARAWSA